MSEMKNKNWFFCLTGGHVKKFVWEAHMIETRFNQPEFNRGLVRKWECVHCEKEFYTNWDYKNEPPSPQ